MSEYMGFSNPLVESLVMRSSIQNIHRREGEEVMRAGWSVSSIVIKPNPVVDPEK